MSEITKESFIVDRLGECTIDSPLDMVDFINEGERIVYSPYISTLASNIGDIWSFELAGPSAKIYHDPAWTKAAIVTAGGLCPGLNDVIKALTRTLLRQYNVPVVYGIKYGYRGLNPKFKLEPIVLTDDDVDPIHSVGGSILGSSRGEQPVDVMVETLARKNINMLFCIGGDGTLRCAHEIAAEIKRRKLAISVIGVPKTIDNDIEFIDKTFGFETAVYMCNQFIAGAHAEAKGAYNGVGLIKVMGRDSGFIAAYATLANSDINYCLVPEAEFQLEGDSPNALLPHLERRLEAKKHAVIIVAEGAGQNLFSDKSEVRDASGNKLHKDIGVFLKERITSYFKAKGKEISVKYFDPSYMIRSVPALGTDAVFCQMLAQNAVHAAMTGHTDMVVGHWNENFTYVPIALATRKRKTIDQKGQLWNSVKLGSCLYSEDYK